MYSSRLVIPASLILFVLLALSLVPVSARAWSILNPFCIETFGCVSQTGPSAPSPAPVGSFSAGAGPIKQLLPSVNPKVPDSEAIRYYSGGVPNSVAGPSPVPQSGYAQPEQVQRDFQAQKDLREKEYEDLVYRLGSIDDIRANRAFLDNAEECYAAKGSYEECTPEEAREYYIEGSVLNRDPYYYSDASLGHDGAVDAPPCSYPSSGVDGDVSPCPSYSNPDTADAFNWPSQGPPPIRGITSPALERVLDSNSGAYSTGNWDLRSPWQDSFQNDNFQSSGVDILPREVVKDDPNVGIWGRFLSRVEDTIGWPNIGPVKSFGPVTPATGATEVPDSQIEQGAQMAPFSAGDQSEASQQGVVGTPDEALSSTLPPPETIGTSDGTELAPDGQWSFGSWASSFAPPDWVGSVKIYDEPPDNWEQVSPSGSESWWDFSNW